MKTKQMERLLDLTGILNEETKPSKKPRRNKMNETSLKRIKVRKINEDAENLETLKSFDNVSKNNNSKRRSKINESNIAVLGDEVPVEIYNELKKMSSTFIVVGVSMHQKRCVMTMKNKTIKDSNLKKLKAMASFSEIGVLNGNLTITLKY